MSRLQAATAFLCALIGTSALGTSLEPPIVGEFWGSRDVAIARSPATPKVRIAIWDSGVDVALFPGQVVLDSAGKPLLRGYDAFKRRQDTAMAVLPASLAARAEELNGALAASDDLEDGVNSPAAEALAKRLETQSAAEVAELTADVGRWSGYAHGTGVADIALAGNGDAEILIARMEWWHGSPPVPCWSHDLADREAASIRDLLSFIVDNGAKVVNMSWGRYESSYLNNLEACAPDMPLRDRQALARYSVEKVRAELRAGMEASPGVLFVGAAGNAATSVQEANPATRLALDNFILVGSVDRSGAKSDFTNTGPELALYANGERVPARLPGGRMSFPSGTSMATPNVTNAAAKMLAVNPRLTGAELRALLIKTADTNATGQRLLHTARAVEAARNAVAADSGEIIDTGG